jgi:hypothetical protein
MGASSAVGLASHDDLQNASPIYPQRCFAMIGDGLILASGIRIHPIDIVQSPDSRHGLAADNRCAALVVRKQRRERRWLAERRNHAS